MWYFLISNSDSYIEIQGSYDRVRYIYFSLISENLLKI